MLQVNVMGVLNGMKVRPTVLARAWDIRLLMAALPTHGRSC